MNNLTAGTKIRYTGDFSNSEGMGEIVAVTPCSFYGQKIDVVLDDGRAMLGLVASSFGPLDWVDGSKNFQVMD